MTATPGLPDAAVIATPGFLTDVLQAGGTLDPASRVSEVAVEPMAVASAVVGALDRLHLRYAGGPAGPPSLVLKLPTANPDNRAFAVAQRMYEREGRFYGGLADRVGIRSPRCHWSLVDPDEHTSALLLEDLGGWDAPRQVDGASLEQARRVVTSLAGLHASAWDAPALTDTDWLPGLADPEHFPFAQLYAGAWPQFAEGWGHLLPTGSLDLGAATPAALENVLRAATAEAPLTLCHGDFRLDNMLFDPAGADVAALDWQAVHRGPGVEDLALFLTQSVPTELRRAHERDLLRCWRNRVVALCPAAAAYPYERAWEHYRRLTLFTPAYAVIVGGSLDTSDEGNRALVTSMAIRAFTAALDLRAAEFLR